MRTRHKKKYSTPNFFQEDWHPDVLLTSDNGVGIEWPSDWSLGGEE